ncbi:6-phosphofructokinase [Planomonospora sphaerica]|uniref:6-phosphofructokinase n=1 Tax=Planomonospora sphaerica TaxID=161355 RepID=A0A171DJ19_9ACTN|nr:ATP-binding protein [Planomonospora sphaerica]GAT68857.1 6-phosphofructokinase [Planomonospora sphaerica]
MRAYAVRPVARDFSAVPESVPEARRFVTAVLAGWGLAAESVEDAAVCVTELAANALTHGRVPGHGFAVTAAVGDGFAQVAVHDHSPRRPRLRRPADTDSCGRGLLIVEELSEQWGLDDLGQDGKAVWVRFKFPAAVGAGQLMALPEPQEEDRWVAAEWTGDAARLPVTGPVAAGAHRRVPRAQQRQRRIRTGTGACPASV